MKKNNLGLVCLILLFAISLGLFSCKVSAQIKYVCIGCGSEYNSKTECENCNVGENCPKKQIGDKTQPDSLYDIVFNDGSAVAYSDDLILTERQKKNVEAVIFYVGTKEYGNTLGKRILGVNVRNNKGGNPLCWAPKDTKGCKEKIESILFTRLTTKPSSGAYYSYDVSTSNSKTTYYIPDSNGLINGKDNWNKICKFDPEGTSLENRKTNYPAFDYVLTVLGEDYYIPSTAEAAVLGTSDVNTVLKFVNGDIVTSEYWTSNNYDYADNAVTYESKISYSSKYDTHINGFYTSSPDFIHIVTVGIKEF